MPRSLVAVLLMLVASPSFAQAVYRWADGEGVTHYTDDPATIPKGAAVFATDGEPISEMGKPGPVPAARPVAVAGPQAVAPLAVNTEPEVPSSSEQYWRGLFRAAKDKVRSLEDEISADRHRTEDVNGLPSNVGYSCWPSSVGYVYPQQYGSTVVVNHRGVKANFGPVPQPGYANPYNTCMQTINPEYGRALARLEKNRSALERANEELHDLERRAAFEAVPNEWRR